MIGTTTIESLFKEMTSANSQTVDVTAFLDCYLLHISPVGVTRLLDIRWQQCHEELDR